MQKHKVISPKNLPAKGSIFWLWCWAISCKLWEYPEWLQAVGYTLIAVVATAQIWFNIKFVEQVDIFKDVYGKR